MSVADEEYHGQEYLEGGEALPAPDMPSGNDEPDDAAHQEARALHGHIPEFSKVVIHGNYGMMCSQNQTLTYHDITLAQARQHKWTFFGMCPSKMTCYDIHDAPVWEE